MSSIASDVVYFFSFVLKKDEREEIHLIILLPENMILAFSHHLLCLLHKRMKIRKKKRKLSYNDVVVI